MLPHVPGVQMQAIPDDIMDVDRAADEDKDSDPNKRISQVKRDRRIVDERELSDSEDEDGDGRRNQSNGKQSSNKRKATSETIYAGTALNGTDVCVPSAPTAATTSVSQDVKITESTTTVSSDNDKATENISLNETTKSVQPSEEEIIPTATSEEAIPITTATAVTENQSPIAAPDENVPAQEAPIEAMNTSEYVFLKFSSTIEELILFLLRTS
ncbi:unnamed protein product [Rotaria socialis]|nr:unnamed protein product [Rotaria socialis]